MPVSGSVLMVTRAIHLDRPYGEIYVKDNAVATTLPDSTGGPNHVQIESFAVNGEFIGMIPDHTENHITILRTGEYQVNISTAILNSAGASHRIHVDLFVNNGATEFDATHGHRTLSAGTDTGSFSMNGMVKLTTGDTVEIWAATERTANSDVIFEDVTLSVHWVGNG